jgi:hypothetical protein
MASAVEYDVTGRPARAIGEHLGRGTVRVIHMGRLAVLVAAASRALSMREFIGMAFLMVVTLGYLIVIGLGIVAVALTLRDAVRGIYGLIKK